MKNSNVGDAKILPMMITVRYWTGDGKASPGTINGTGWEVFQLSL